MTASQIRNRASGIATDDIVDHDLRHLKRLLFVDEQRELGALRGEVARLDRRVGSHDRFCRSVADSLVVAMQAVEIENHRDLAKVMAPLVISGIRREIAESRDAMVETLYPITGRLVAAAVAAAVKDLSDDINRKLETSLSPKQIKLRIKAALTRRPLSELVLAEAAHGRFDRLMLIDRPSGAVLATARDLPAEDDEGSLDLIGGLVSAIVEFANHALHDIHGELRSIDVGGRSVLLRASPLYIIAAMTSGPTVSPKLQLATDEAFLGLLESMADPIACDASEALSALKADIDARFTLAPAKKGVSPLTIIGAIVALGLGLLVAQTWMTSRHHRAEAALLAEIERSPATMNYPLRLDFDRGEHVIRAFGLLSTSAAVAALKERLATAFPNWPVDARIAVDAQTPYAMAANQALKQADLRIAALRERADKLERSQGDLGDRLAKQSASSATHLAAIEGALDKRATNQDLARTASALGGLILTPERQLDAAALSTAVFFGDAGSYRDPARAGRDLSALASALKAVDGARLRIVGYADGAGTPKGNADAARKRAERVAADLAALGIDPGRVIMVTTRSPLPIADGGAANRRVVFELAYRSE